MKQSLIWKILLPALIVLAISGCVAIEDGSEAQNTALRDGGIGAILPLSGDGAIYGVPLQRVALIAINEINENGGLLDKPMEVIFEDGGCNADAGNRAAQKLIDVSKVTLIYGGFCSSETLASAPLAEQAKVILFSPGSSSPAISDAGDFVFRNYPSDSTQGKILASYANSKGYKKVGMISEQQDYTLGIKMVFEQAFSGAVLSENYTSDSSDFRTQILKLKGEGVDVYFINPQTPPKADLIFKQLEEQGIKGPFILNDVAIGFQENITKYSSLLDGAIGAEATYDRGNPGIAKLQEKYMELYKEELPYLTYMATAYDAVYILKEAVEAVGNFGDTEAIRDYLYGIKDRNGLAGLLTIDNNGDPLAGHIMRTVNKGNVEDYKQ